MVRLLYKIIRYTTLVTVYRTGSGTKPVVIKVFVPGSHDTLNGPNTVPTYVVSTKSVK